MSHTEPDHQLAPALPSYPTLRLLYSGSRGVIGNPGDGEVTAWILRKGQTRVGRAAADAQSIVVADDPRTSERHASIDVSADRLIVKVRDTSSTNGTFVNGERIAERRLEDGDVLRIGNSLLLVRFESMLDAITSDAAKGDPNLEATLRSALTGEAPAFRRQRSELAAAAKTRAPILLLGESGTGKDVAACTVHQASGLRGRLVPVNCAAIPEHLAESLLFGHLGGAYTGASKAARRGFFQEADGGTLFLDEIGDLPLEVQPKLLRALETDAVTLVGATQPEPCRVRIIAATNRDLAAEISHGRFRGDLYARIAAVVVELPPLRFRREDILPLFVRFLSSSSSPKPPALTGRLAEALLLYRWPYNVRELIKLADLAKIRLRSGMELDLPLIEARLRNPGPSPIAITEAGPTIARAQRKVARAPLSRESLEQLMTEHGGIISKVAEAGGRSRKHIRRLLVDFKLRPPKQ